MTASNSGILVGANSKGKQVSLLPGMANRHGLIAGATGTGKTVSMQLLMESFASRGVPVFSADVKGDLSGIAVAATPGDKVEERIQKIGIEGYTPRGNPVLFWDFFGKTGHPVRTTISEMGPLLLGRLLDLNDVQEGVLEIAFTIADDEGLLLLDLKDLKSLIQWMDENEKELKKEYGNISGATLGAIQRRLVTLNEAGGEIFFGEPALKLDHLMQKDFSGNGVISILDARSLMTDPRLYSTFLLWLLSELFEQLPEVGDPDKPKMVFFFDEAHLLFEDTPKALQAKIEQVVRLIRSKGVGVYFVTQNPTDVPENILGQLGHKVQHALRAFTPKDQKAVRAAAQTFRENPELETQKVITELGVGEALVSVLDEEGSPTQVERLLIAPPQSRIGPLSAEERDERFASSPIKGFYEEVLDRESAFEKLEEREKELQKKLEEEAREEEEEQYERKAKRRTSGRQTAGEAFFKTVVRTAGRMITNQVMRGILGGRRR